MCYYDPHEGKLNERKPCILRYKGHILKAAQIWQNVHYLINYKYAFQFIIMKRALGYQTLLQCRFSSRPYQISLYPVCQLGSINKVSLLLNHTLYLHIVHTVSKHVWFWLRLQTYKGSKYTLYLTSSRQGIHWINKYTGLTITYYSTSFWNENLFCSTWNFTSTIVLTLHLRPLHWTAQAGVEPR